MRLSGCCYLTQVWLFTTQIKMLDEDVLFFMQLIPGHSFARNDLIKC